MSWRQTNVRFIQWRHCEGWQLSLEVGILCRKSGCEKDRCSGGWCTRGAEMRRIQSLWVLFVCFKTQLSRLLTKSSPDPEPGSLSYSREEVQHWLGFLERERNEIVSQYVLCCLYVSGDFQGFLNNCTLVQRVLLNTFQKRSVSSPAPVTIASPSGETAWNGRTKGESLVKE